MQKDTIVQFIGYITALEPDAFAASWDAIAGRHIGQQAQSLLQQSGAKARYKYLSLHQGTSDSFPIGLASKKRSDGVAEHAVKLVSFGGYTAQASVGGKENKNGAKVMAFVGHEENDLDFYHQTGLHQSVTVYEAYYESCAYSHVLEYIVAPANSAALVQHLKNRHGNEVAAYIDCPIPVVL
jgi:hypothetical protein